ncbi:MAG TPA: lytic transglycosylase domain-containing protein [Ramlibacter sp.]|uniref:lytic transglycosylase domain-containing protein n=1 Tax=Ramlibacter sp. TaxID=1917967 RepID=UPI002C6D1493|nr:lytic transglycosylase domain-containing protein [Ramlibacter sp.]HVZ42791.1 lytic transglycosylase domain-containing protein [Ramlibacter sp.]
MDWTPMLEQCAPQVAAATMRAVAQVESGFDPLAMHVNGHWRLGRRARDAGEAKAWLRWLMARGHSVDVGLMQINTANFAALGLTPDNAFDPCRNLAAGAALLQAAYRRTRATESDAQIALRRAVSAYNTGREDDGFRNGYVARVVNAARPTGARP